MELLSDEAIQKALNDFPKWKLVDEKWLQRKYNFQKYLSGLDFVQEVAEYAQEKRHHPVINIDHTTVTLSISSIEMDGLTNLDVEMIEHFNKLFDEETKN
ncbi:MAG: 4a-hydroxytetrahydrobiopterin dehydratase [Atopostipes sp.]|nr:4a-hydroxytetrahydrobiopterin dehydratase [Atopostipes sp.]